MSETVCWSSSLYLLALTRLLVLVSSLPATSGPAINVTKHISFAHFGLDDPRVVSDVKLLGSVKLSVEKSVIQIPDESVAFDLRHQAGRAIYSSPVRLLDPNTRTPASFQTTFAFQFSNSSDASADNHGGSGLTFIIVPDEFTVGRPGPWLGMLNDACQEDYKAVGIEFDTRQNPEFGDPNDNHVGINLGTLVSTKTIDASDFGVFLKDGSVHRAWITYDGPRRWMDIRLGSDIHDYPYKLIFSGSLDLSPHLNEYMFIGFSASTGNKTQIHNVLSWNFSSTSQAFLRFPSEETCQSKITTFQKSEATTPAQSTARKRSNKEPISFFIFVAVAVLALVTMIGFFFCRRRDNSKLTGLPEKAERPRPPNKPRRFTFNEVSLATRGFSETEMLGSDARGVYYRGKLSNGCQVAIKRLTAEFLNSQPGLDRKRLLKEIGAMSRVRHPNLVPIRGWCHDNREMMILYDFYTNGSLDKWLFGAGVLPWTRRFKVINDVAEALSFLHSKQLAHKNMKTSSVFLDVSFRAGLGDFGMVLSAADSKRFESAISQTADVFEFGIFVLEVVSGRGRLDPEVKQEERDLVDFAWRMHVKDEKVKVVDGRMGSLVNLEQAIRVLDIGLLCTLNESKGRPAMEEVVEYLSTDTQIPELPACRPVALFPYNSATGLCTGYSCGPFK